MSDTYEYVDGKPAPAPKPERSSETIKERIDRVIKEQQAAGSARHASEQQSTSTKPQWLIEEEKMDDNQRYVEKELLRSAKGENPLGATTLAEIFRLCELRGKPIPDSKKGDFEYIRYHRLDWLKQWDRISNLTLLHPPVPTAVVPRVELGEQEWSSEWKAEPRINSRGQVAGVVLKAPHGLTGSDWYFPFEGYDLQLMSDRVTTTKEENAPKPGPWTQTAIEDVTKILGRRGHSYTTNEEFENFQDQAAMAGITLRQVFRGMLGQKLTREQSTWKRIEEAGDDDVEALVLQWIDSIRDICGYGLLFFGWAKSEADERNIKA